MLRPRNFKGVSPEIGTVAVKGSDLLGSAGSAKTSGLADLVTQIARYQTNQDLQEESIRVQNKNTVETAKLERRLQLWMDNLKDQDDFGTMTVEEFNRRWNENEQKELRFLKDTVYKNDDAAFAKFESAYYTVFNNNRRIFRAEKQDKMMLDTLITLNNKSINRNEQLKTLETKHKNIFDSNAIWTWYESEKVAIENDAKQKNKINGTGTQPEIEAETRLLRVNTFKEIFLKAGQFQKPNPAYNPAEEESETNKLTIPDWQKIKKYLKDNDEIYGEFWLPDELEELNRWAGSTQDNDDKINARDLLNKQNKGRKIITEALLKDPASQDYITDDKIREIGQQYNLELKEINLFVKSRLSFTTVKVEESSKKRFAFYSNLILAGQITDINEVVANSNLDFVESRKIPFDSKVDKAGDFSVLSDPLLTADDKIRLGNLIASVKKNASEIKASNNLFKNKVKTFKKAIQGTIGAKSGGGDIRYGNFEYEAQKRFYEKLGTTKDDGTTITADDLLNPNSKDYIFTDEFVGSYKLDIQGQITETNEINFDLKDDKKDKDFNKDGLPIINSQDEFEDLASGTRYVDGKTGKVGQKP